MMEEQQPDSPDTYIPLGTRKLLVALSLFDEHPLAEVIDLNANVYSIKPEDIAA